MGKKQSIYEKPGGLEYYKFSAEEYALVKNVWSGIEINPQFHGNAYLRSFCEMYPQYVKFFTLEPALPVNFGARTTAKFSIIMETLGYLLLDFNRKPKRLDRFVGYIAMIHKDMRLDEEDMRKIVTWLINYLLKTYPTQMTAQCQEAISKFMDSVLKELCIKMELFRDYDNAQSDMQIQEIKPPWGRCPILAEPPIFGKTRLYWYDRKKEWDARLNEWMTISATLGSSSVSPVDDEDTIHAAKSRLDIEEDEEDVIGMLHRKVSILQEKRKMLDPASKHSLSNGLNKTAADEDSSNNQAQKHISRAHNDKQRSQDPQRSYLACSPRKPTKDAPRERRRARNLVPDNPANSPAVLHRRLRNKNVDHSTFNEIMPEEDKKETSGRLEAIVKSHNTARQRHRERSVSI